MPMSDFLPARALWPALLAKMGEAGSARALRPLWEEVAGPTIARRTSVERLAEGQLWISVHGSAWLAELSQQAPVLLDRLAEKLGPGVVRHLRFEER